MAGNVPPSIRFLNFKGVLSSASIQALCIILKRNNIAYSDEMEDPMSPASSMHNIMSPINYISPRDSVAAGVGMGIAQTHYATPVPTSGYPMSTPVQGQFTRNSRHSATSGGGSGVESSAGGSSTGTSTSFSLTSPRDRESPERMSHYEYHYRNPLKPIQGLIGLAITHTAFTAKDIEKLMELLSVYASAKYSKTMRKPSGTSTFGPGSRHKGYDHHSNGLYSPKPKGLRYLDLSHNKLTDIICADMLSASTMGPLEGLDLGSNNIKNGKEFVDVLSRLTNPESNVSFLRYLGLSNNNLPNKTVCQILESIQLSTNITSVDLSLNSITSTPLFEKTLESFLKYNESVRILDLGYNKLGVSTVEKIYLGLEENCKGSLLMLPLVGNQDMGKSPNFSLVQKKLNENRKNYKKNMNRYNDAVTRYKDYLNEEIAKQPQQVHQNNYEALNTHIPTFSLQKPTNISNLEGIIEHSYEDAEILDTTRLDQHLQATADIQHALSLSKEKDSDNNSITSIDGTVISPDNMNSTAMTEGSSNATINSPTNSLVVATAVYAHTSSSAISSPLAPVISTTPTSSKSNKIGLNVNSSKHSSFRSTSNNSEYFSPLETSSNASTRQITFNEGTERDSEHSTATHGIPPLLRSSSGINNDIPSFYIFFSAPLVWRDKAGKHHPLEILDYDSERDAITKLLTEVHRDISVSFQFATTDSLRTALSLGCRALHFSGHGHPQFVRIILIPDLIYDYKYINILCYISILYILYLLVNLWYTKVYYTMCAMLT